MTDHPQRLRRLPPPPVASASPADGRSDDRRPWTVERVVRGLRRRATRLLNAFRDRALLPAASRAALGSSLYYAFASGAFRREHQGVLAGRRRYRQQGGRVGEHEYLLRRNIHMLEKGLCMRPRRPVFARDYIAETVRCYRAMAELSVDSPKLVDAVQIRWARDVLATYFAVTGSHPTLDRARVEFADSPALRGEEAVASAPYARDLGSEPPVHYRDLLSLAYRRRSVRWFDSRPVPRQLIDQAVEVAALSPSACNRQPFEFRIFDDPALVQKVARIPKGTRGFVDNFPAFVVVVGRLRAFFSERDRHLIYIDAALSSMAFVLALESLGLSSCCINWADDAEQEHAMARALSLAPDERVVMCIALGYPDPDGLVPYSEKRPLELLRTYNRA